MLRGHLAAFRYCCLVYVPSLALLPRISPTRKPPKDLILSLHVDSEHPFPAKPCLTARQRAMAAAQGEEARSGTLWECVSNLKASSEDLTPVSTRHAAVLVPLYEDESGTVRVILTKRSDKLNKHAGEVALPGGKQDDEDIDDIHTALREAHEEIALEPCDVEVVAELPPFLSKHGLSVKPVVGCVPSGFQPVPNEEEVSEVFTMPLHTFLEDGEHHHYEDKTFGEIGWRIHYFKYSKFTVRCPYPQSPVP